MVMQLVLGIVLFLVIALMALPLWLRRRPVSRVPGQYYLVQAFQDDVIKAWRDYRIALDDYRKQRDQPAWLGRQVAAFAPWLADTLHRDYRDEMRVWLDDVLAHSGEAGFLQAIIVTVLDFQCGDDRPLQSQALYVALDTSGLGGT